MTASAINSLKSLLRDNESLFEIFLEDLVEASGKSREELICDVTDLKSYFEQPGASIFKVTWKQALGLALLYDNHRPFLSLELLGKARSLGKKPSERMSIRRDSDGYLHGRGWLYMIANEQSVTPETLVVTVKSEVHPT